jgi:hypothetical protein
MDRWVKTPLLLSFEKNSARSCKTKVQPQARHRQVHSVHDFDVRQANASKEKQFPITQPGERYD